MADIKTLLKEARKLIDDKKYQEAQECCKSILRKDKQNYFGLVLLGKSLQDADQAPLAYQKAISSKPDQLLAWQGLANYYERKDDATLKTKLFAIYEEMLNLKLEDDKSVELITKLGQLGCLLKNSKSITILLNYLNRDIDDKLKDAAIKQLIDILEADVPCNEDAIPSVVNLLEKIILKSPSDTLELLQGKVILQKSNFPAALKQVINLQSFSRNVQFREWVCKFMCKKYVENGSYDNFPIENYINNITEGIENSKYPGLLRSILSYEKGLYIDAYKECVPLINYQEADATEATLVLKCTMKLEKWAVTQKLVMNFLSKVKDQNFTIKLKKILFVSLASQFKWKQAFSVGKDIPLDSFSLDELPTLAECYIEVNESADCVMEKLQSTKYFVQLQALLLLKQEKYSEIVALLQNSGENAVNLFMLGRAYWELKEYEQSQINLLKAAKMNSNHANTFVYLGNLYNFIKVDLEKAKKCYEKAYSLNKMDLEIVKHLSEVYIKLELKDTDFELLKSAQKCISNNEAWLNFRLGLHYLNGRDWENAIGSFRNVIKSDPKNITALECLADAYYSRGSFTSALRAYNMVISLNPSKSSHCLTRIGYIYSLLTQYEDAILTFEKVFVTDPYSILALKGIAETWMRIAKKREAAKMYGIARDHVQFAVNYITKALSKQKLFSCFWKLLGDALIFITKLPNKYAYVYIMDSFNDFNKDSIKKGKIDIFPQAIACYSYIAKQKHQCSSYDLAAAYLEFYHETKNQVNCKIAFTLTIACLKENPSLWRNWNLLGKICLFMNKYAFAQHCFIKGLIVTRKWSVAKIWCNLGTLYLKLKLYKLANYCFWRGQSTLPSYPQSWIGQALIAEDIREEEAMDLFRHASRLGFHPESALGYADWVCRTLKIRTSKEDRELKYVIEGLHAIPYAKDLVEWFSIFDESDACACTILGILQERNGLLRAAYISYEKALQYAEDDKKNIAFLNMGRILLRLERYNEAVKIFQSVTEASLHSASGLALALYKQGEYEASYSAYDTALHWLSNEDNEKADILVAMAGIVYMFKGADDAKTLLFHSIQISQNKPTAYSLFAICSLGLIHSDQSLSKLALSELKKYEKDDNFGFDIGFLKSYLLVSQGHMEMAIKLLSDSLHDQPNDALLWFFMAQYCLRSSNTRARVASGCAQRALCSAHHCESRWESAKMIATASVAEHIAGQHDKALTLAKSGLHMYPQQPEIWAALLFSLFTHKRWLEKKDWILSAVGYMRRQLKVSRPIVRWANLLEKKMHSK